MGRRRALELWVAMSLAGCAPSSLASVAVRPPLVAAVPARTAQATTAASASALPLREAPPDLFVRCEDRASCPNAVGMLVVQAAGDQEAERCTATLIARDRVLTASHCLAEGERHAGATCSGTWIAFPETADAPAAWLACKQVVSVDGVVDEGALHQEHACSSWCKPARARR